MLGMEREEQETKRVFLIGVDGHGGSGKSTLASALARELGAEILHTDDFASWDNPVGWWPLLIEHALEPIARGARTLSYQRSKWWETHHPDPAVDQPVTPIMILEGVTALRREFRPYLSFGIFVDTPAEICLQRGFARDQGVDGKSDEEILAMWREWIAAEDAYIDGDDPVGYANVVVDGTKPFAEQFAEIVRALEKYGLDVSEQGETGT